MPTVVDSLVIQLGMDSSGFNAAIRNATNQLQALKKAGGEVDITLKKNEETSRRTGKEMARHGDDAAQYFKKMRDQALSLMAVLVGGQSISSAVQSTVTSLAGLGRSAQILGTSVEGLSTFRQMIQEAGGSADEAEASLRRVQQALDDVKTTGRSGLDPFFQRVGLGKNAEDQYLRFADFAERYKNRPDYVRQTGRQAGYSDVEILTAMEGRRSVQRRMDQARRDAPTKEQADAMRQVESAWSRLTNAAIKLRNEFLVQFGPAIEKFLDTITEFMHANPGIATGIGVAGMVSGTALGAFKLLKSFFGGAALVGSAAALTGSAAALTAAAGVLAGAGAIGKGLGPGLGGGSGRTGGPRGAPLGGGRIAKGAGIAGVAAGVAAQTGLLGDGFWADVASGAGLGATVGSVVPGVGTGFGAAIGAVGGAAWNQRANIANWFSKPAQKAADYKGGAADDEAMASQLGVSVAQVRAMKQGVANIESRGGQYNIMGGSSNRFAGKYQMGRAEIDETARRLGETPPSTQQFLNDPAMQERYWNSYTLAHHAYLMKNSPAYAAMSPEQRLGYLASGQLGAGNVRKYLEGGGEFRDANNTGLGAFVRSVQKQQALVQGGQYASNDNSRNSTVNVNGPIVVNTQASDGRGVARSLRGEFTNQMNTGLA